MNKAKEATRICSVCREELPLNAKNFYRNRSSKNGFHQHCKECQKERTRVAYGVPVSSLKLEKSTLTQAKKGNLKALAQLRLLQVTAIWNGREMVRL